MKGAKEKEWIEQTARKFTELLGLINYDVGAEYNEEKCRGYLATSNHYPYTEHIIYYGDMFLRDFERGEHQEQDILHEVIHILTDPLYDKATKRYVTDTELTDERELLTDKLSAIIYRLTAKPCKTKSS